MAVEEALIARRQLAAAERVSRTLAESFGIGRQAERHLARRVHAQKDRTISLISHGWISYSSSLGWLGVGLVLEAAPDAALKRGAKSCFAVLRMIVYHGTTIDCLEGIQREGLRPGTFVSQDRALASQYSWLRAMTLGADSCVLFELDVPDSAVSDAESWWWARSQLQLPFGCPPSRILSVDHSDPEAFSSVG
ncbi:MAG: hypothetical protein M3065_17300 [Actinomycetota bacterium]|nr:hypothetical protein [Actinomycetota bacterium]